MATEKRKPNPQLISPKGVFVYPALNKPDKGNASFPKPDGEYKVTLRVANEVADAWREGPLKAVIARSTKEAEEAFAALPVATRKKMKEITFNECGTTEYDKETEEETGFTTFKFTMKASGTRPDKTTWSMQPGIFDSKGKALPQPPEIWGGSEGYVSFEAAPYFIPGTGAAGVSFRMKAVQLTKLVQGGQRDAAGYGFAAREDGFDGSEYESPAEEFGGAAQAGDPGAEGNDEF